KGWKKIWRGDAFSPPISAITLNYNTFEINVSPSKLGRAPQVKLEPAGTNINIINKAVTSNKKGSISAHWLDGENTLVIKGRISPRRRLQKFELAVRDPALYTGNVFKKALEELGIKVNGNVRMGEVPNWSKHVYTQKSVPLYLIINEYNKESVNVIGENLMKTLGAQFIGAPGTWEKGARVISDFLIGIGIDDQFRIVDGSGLSILNRISPQALTEVLKYAYTNRIIGEEFVNSLPIAGVDGTLEKRFRRSQVEGKVFAKTGYLNNVRALSGYAFTKSGEVLVFSILSNGIGWKAKSFQDELLKEMVECCNINGSFNN
ncbi:MAG: D-alanyl-D-alanine carboxypeptidase/D-alanyl-D-alanine-endopeptidase, partial [Thermodesulfobacteriota bacterium]